MPRTIDQIRASKLPSNMMQFAARGALQVPAAENIEILVYLAQHNNVFGEPGAHDPGGMGRKIISGRRRRSANLPRSVGLFHLPRQSAARIVARAAGEYFGIRRSGGQSGDRRVAGVDRRHASKSTRVRYTERRAAGSQVKSVLEERRG